MVSVLAMITKPTHAHQRPATFQVLKTTPGSSPSTSQWRPVAKGRILGPFLTCSVPEVQVSRIGVIPKKSKPGKWRHIMDPSFLHGKSVNDGIDADMASLSYIKVEVTTRAAQLGRGLLLAKFNIEEAYRIVPVHPRPTHIHSSGWCTAMGNWTARSTLCSTLPGWFHRHRITQFRPVRPKPTKHNGNM